MKKEKNKINTFVIIGIIYIIVFLTISTAYSFFNTNLSIQATVGMANNEHFDADYILEAKWQNGDESQTYYHYSTTLTYTGNIPTVGWKYYIKVPYDTEVVGCFNADSCVVEGEILTIKNASYNRNLSPNNQSVSFGFQIKTNKNDYEYQALGATFITDPYDEDNTTPPTITPPEENKDQENATSVDYFNATLTSQTGWDNVSLYTLDISNSSPTKTIEHWSLEIHYPIGSSIQSIWGSEYTYNEQTGILTLYDPDWNPILPPNSSIQTTIYMETPFPTPYTPTIGHFIATNLEGEKITSNVVWKGSTQ